MSAVRQKVISAALWGGVIFPPLAVLFLIRTLAVNMPFQDDWDSLAVVTGWRNGTCTFDDFWHQHSEHRIIVLKLLIWIIGGVTGGNVVAEMLIGLCFAVLTLWMIHALFDATLRRLSPALVTPTTVIASFLLFSLAQYENWFWGTASLQLFFLNLCTVTLVWALTCRQDRNWSLIAAFGCALLGMFTEASGLVLWVTGAIGIALATAQEPRRTKRLLAWTAGGTPAIAVYFWGFNWSASLVARNAYHAFRLVTFAAAGVGLPLAMGHDPAVSVATGLAGILSVTAAALLLANIREPLFQDLKPILLLVAHTVVVAFLIALGRSDQGLQTAMLSHYAFCGTLFWIGTVAVLIATYTAGRSSLARHWDVVGRSVVTSVIVLAVIGYSQTNVSGWREAYARSANLQMALSLLAADIEPDPEVRRFLYPEDGERIRRQLRELRGLRMGPFSERTEADRARLLSRFQPQPSPVATDGFLEGGDCETITGWAWDPLHPDQSIRVDLWSGNTRIGTVPASWFRWDLWTAGKGDGRHGFRFAFPEMLELDSGRSITANYAGTDQHLKGSPKIIMCRQ